MILVWKLTSRIVWFYLISQYGSFPSIIRWNGLLPFSLAENLEILNFFSIIKIYFIVSLLTSSNFVPIEDAIKIITTYLNNVKKSRKATFLNLRPYLTNRWPPFVVFFSKLNYKTMAFSIFNSNVLTKLVVRNISKFSVTNSSFHSSSPLSALSSKCWNINSIYFCNNYWNFDLKVHIEIGFTKK